MNYDASSHPHSPTQNKKMKKKKKKKYLQYFASLNIEYKWKLHYFKITILDVVSRTTT